MIRVAKPEQAPPILRNRGRTTTEANKVAFDADPESYTTGARRFEFDNSLYGAKSVKNALIKAQHGKCGFCEAKIRHVDHGDVEHFRPKGGVADAPDEPMRRPGYYWLAYAWDNLFLACAICNQTGKKNLFPLADASRRARSHHDDHTVEPALLIDPARDDPEAHIGFRQEIAFAIDGTERGQVTIDVLRLNRDELAERRLDRARLLQALHDLLSLLPVDDEGTVAAGLILADATSSSAEYAGMARWLLR